MVSFWLILTAFVLPQFKGSKGIYKWNNLNKYFQKINTNLKFVFVSNCSSYSVDWCLLSSIQKGIIRITNIKIKGKLNLFFFFLVFTTVLWFDHRIVNMVSTLPVYLSSVSRVIACSIPRQSQKVISYIELFYPSCIHLYNQMIGRSRSSWIFLSLVQFDFCFQKWTISIILAYISISISNTHKLYCHIIQHILFTLFVENCITDLLHSFNLDLTNTSASYYYLGSYSLIILGIYFDFNLPQLMYHIRYIRISAVIVWFVELIVLLHDVIHVECFSM